MIYLHNLYNIKTTLHEIRLQHLKMQHKSLLEHGLLIIHNIEFINVRMFEYTSPTVLLSNAKIRYINGKTSTEGAWQRCNYKYVTIDTLIAAPFSLLNISFTLSLLQIMTKNDFGRKIKLLMVQLSYGLIYMVLMPTTSKLRFWQRNCGQDKYLFG